MFYGVSRVKTDLHSKYIIWLCVWLMFLIISVVYTKKWPKCVRISKLKLMLAKIWSIIIFQTLTARGNVDLSVGIILSEKNYGGTGLISEKTEALYAELNERVEAATSSYFRQPIFYNIFILCL